MQTYKPVEIKNLFGVGKTLFQGYLSQHTDYCDIDCSSTLEINLLEDGSLIDDIMFKNINGDISTIIDYKLYVDGKSYEIELAILREIQTDITMRDAIINANIPIELDDDGFPLSVKNQLISRIPNQIECNAKICAGGDDCNLRNAPQKDIYSQKILITATLTQYNPTQLKLFCWSK